MASQPPVVSLTEIQELAQCRHHWVIQPAPGPVSQGVCQACGEERDFKNFVESASWGDTRVGGRTSKQADEDVAETAAGRHEEPEKE